MADTFDASSADTPSDWPLFGWIDDVRPVLADLRARGVDCVLATLHTVVGGAPRPVGAQMLVAEGRLVGYLSGGCIEGDIAARAADVLETGEPQWLAYGESAPFPDIRLVCGGRVDILLERIVHDDGAVADLLTMTARRRLALWASDGDRRVCMDAATQMVTTVAAEPLHLSSRDRLGEVMQALHLDPALACVRAGGMQAIALRRWPQRRLVVVGHDPTALAIAGLALQSGFETHLVRPKGPETAPPLPDVIYHRQEPAEAFAQIGLDAWSYVAVATHELEADEAALAAALPSRAAYVGVLGARRRLPERLARLQALGLAPEVIARLHAPIGLDIGGKAPFEIAVSVLAEVMGEDVRTRPQAVLDLPSGANAAAA